MDREFWNEKYAAKELIWTAEANRFLIEKIGASKPGRAIDLAAGEGRNAIWLAKNAWRVDAIEFSDVAIGKGKQLAAKHGVDVNWIAADLLDYTPEAAAYDLVLIMYLQLPWNEMRVVLERAAAAVATGGTFLLVAHDRSNIEAGYGGPQMPAILYTADAVAEELGDLQLLEAAIVERPVETDAGNVIALDCLVRATRSAGSV